MSAATAVLPTADHLTARLSAAGLTTPELVPDTIRDALLLYAGREVTGSRLGSSLAGAARRHLGLPLTPYTREELTAIHKVLATLLVGLLPDLVRAAVDDEQVVADALAAIR